MFAAITGCDDGPTGPAPISSIQLAPSSQTLASGASATLTVTILDVKGKPLDGRVIIWASADPTVATVTGAGLVTAGLVRGGTDQTTTITATSEGKSGSATITVTPVPVGRVQVSVDSLTLLPGDTTTLQATVTDDAGGPLTGRAVTWNTSDTLVAKIDFAGLVTVNPYFGGDIRSARLVATSESRRDTTLLVVRPLPVQSLRITGVPADSILLVGGTLALGTAMTGPGSEALSGRASTWSSNATSVATVSATGVVTPAAAGTVVITAISEGIEASLRLFIKAPVTVPPTTATAPVTTTVLEGAVAMTIPPGATTVSTLTVAPAPIPPVDDRALPGAAFVFGPPGTTFATPITIGLRFDPLAVPAGKQPKLRIALVTPSGLQEVAGGSVDLDARIVSADITHFSTYTVVVPPDPASLQVVAGGSQEVVGGSMLPITPQVRVLDDKGRPISRERVRFRVTGGGGVLSDTSVAITDTAGLATMPGQWILGHPAGAQSLSVTIEGSSLEATISAQSVDPRIVLHLYDTPTLLARVGEEIRVPIIVDLSKRGSLDLASLTTVIRWDPEALAYLGADAERWVDADGGNASVTVGAGSVESGSIRIAGFTIGATTETFILRTIRLRPLRSGNTSVVPEVITAGSSTGSRLSLITRPLEISVEPNAIPVATVTVLPATVTLGIGGISQFNAALRAADGTTLTDRAIQWRSEDAAIATVSAGGKVTAVAAGITRIYAASEGREGSATVAVSNLTATPVIALQVGVTEALAGRVGDDLAIPLQIDLTGRLNTDLASLAATISWDPTRFAFVRGTIGDWTDDEGNAARLTVNTTGTATGSLALAGFTTKMTTRSFTMYSLVLRPLLAGSSLISALTTSAGDASGAAVTVTPRNLTIVAQGTTTPVATITVSPAQDDIPVGQSRSFTATVRAADGSVITDRLVSWSSSAPTIATIAYDGQVTALTAGSATITARADGISGAAEVLVSDTTAAARLLLKIGETATLTGKVGEEITIPLLVDLSNRGSLDVASIAARITWTAGSATYVANGAGTWRDDDGASASLTVNTADADSGTLSLAGFTTGRTTNSFVLRTLTLRPTKTGQLTVNGVVTTAGSATGANLGMTVRPLTITVQP